MPNLFGHEYSKEELHQFTSTLSQVAGIQHIELADGRERGMRAASIYTGSGFRFDVLIDRALDIGRAEYNGRPLAWLYPALGPLGQYEPQGNGWLRTFGGGLVTTCGLTHFGQTEIDGNEPLGLHGRISNLPAQQVRTSEEWRGDDYVLEIEGVTRQAVLFGENLSLHRKVTTRLGATSFTIEDVVRNDGFRATPHMILYHCNIGFPVVSPDSELIVNDESVIPRDEPARAGLSRHTRFDSPMPDFAEQVFFHKPRVVDSGQAVVAIVNRSLEYGVFIRYRAAELPCLAQWKMMGAGEYVCALEPANQWETPRHKLRQEGRLKFLGPGEEIYYHLEIGALIDRAAIAAFRQGSF